MSHQDKARHSALFSHCTLSACEQCPVCTICLPLTAPVRCPAPLRLFCLILQHRVSCHPSE